jgi:hypothetical protein
MKNFLFLFLFFCLIITQNLAQKQVPFQGKLVYKVTKTDSLIPNKKYESNMVVFTNDTLVRIETENIQLGKQILIKNLLLKKYYVLLEINEKKFAIQQHVKEDSCNTNYQLKNKFGTKKFANKKAKLVVIKNTKTNSVQNVYYFKGISNKYLDVFPEINGLAVDYKIATEEGIYHYQLIEFSTLKVAKDLFGIPSEYKKVSFDEFIDEMMKMN